MAIEQWHVDTPKTIDLETVRQVRVNMMGGSINVMTHELPSTRVEVSSLTGRDMKIAIDGDTLIIDHPQLGWGSLGASARTLVDPPKATVSVLVPKHVSVNVKATSADVLVTGVDGDIAITTVAGEHFVDGTSGKLQLTSASGELSVRGHDGVVEARTATGDVTVTGPIKSFDGNTISGSTVVDVAGEDAAPTSVASSSVSGAITVRLPDETNASVQLTTVAGKAQLGDTIVEPLYGKQVRHYAPQAGEPITEVKVNTVAGRVTVLGGLPMVKEPGAWAGPGAGAGDAENTGDADSTSDTGTTDDTAAAQPAAWSVPMNPNVDLSSAPQPEANIVPPTSADAQVPKPSPAPFGTHTAATGAPAGTHVEAGHVQHSGLTDETDRASTTGGNDENTGEQLDGHAGDNAEGEEQR
ncbi:MAG: DUF4097 family beta strand repeat-containing protein [Gulosibacter sp.]|uniref:DUF4097 family beta strand repeat-containing protein n=1 Tax=Gulosibacter sp. TaxID=2817531 RepID=UPI003F8FFF8D